MSDMIERVAKAICEAYGHEWRTGTYPAMTGPNFEMEDHDADRLNNRWRHIARAAIEAMHNPPDEIVQAMCEVAIDGPGYVDFYPSLNDCGRLFNAAVNEILHGSALSQDTHSLPLKPQEAVNAGIGAPPPSDAGTNPTGEA